MRDETKMLGRKGFEKIKKMTRPPYCSLAKVGDLALSQMFCKSVPKVHGQLSRLVAHGFNPMYLTEKSAV